MVKLGKLWGDAVFSSLSPDSKLIYIYLATQPSISTLGVVEVTAKKVKVDLDIDFATFHDCLCRLVGSDLVRYIDRGDYYTIVVTDHFNSLPKSKLHLRKAITEGKSADEKLNRIFHEVFVPEDFQSTSKFAPPTAQEVTDYALSLGHLVDGAYFVRYYSDNDWYNKNNKKVRSWKRTLERVWCRDENKLEIADGAPSGYEFFHVETEDGNKVFPESWVDGQPNHSDFLKAEILRKEFKNR